MLVVCDSCMKPIRVHAYYHGGLKMCYKCHAKKKPFKRFSVKPTLRKKKIGTVHKF